MSKNKSEETRGHEMSIHFPLCTSHGFFSAPFCPASLFRLGQTGYSHDAHGIFFSHIEHPGGSKLVFLSPCVGFYSSPVSVLL